MTNMALKKKLYVEYANYDIKPTIHIVDDVFKAIDLGVGGISVLPHYLPKINSIIKNALTLSCPIDYPLGCSPQKSRHAEVIKAAHFGATAIDIVCNMAQFLDGKHDQFTEELLHIKGICRDYGVSFRVMFDHRSVDPPSLIDELFFLLKSVGPDYLFCSTGYLVDDPIDNIMLCEIANTDHNILSICNGNLYLPKYTEYATKANIFGLRFHKLASLGRFYGV